MIWRKNGSHKTISEILGSDRIGNFPKSLCTQIKLREENKVRR